MASLKGSKTEANLKAAFAGESQARNKYTYYASKAKKEGYEQISAIFLETAGNEKEHAELWFKHLEGGEIKDTISNLKDAADGERYEWTEMYKQFAEEAREEGFDVIAAQMEGVAKIEKAHEERYLKLLANVEGKKVFEREAETVWVCRNCGHIHKGKAAPGVCPVCAHVQAYFELRAEIY
jgi:rubrerythrin